MLKNIISGQTIPVGEFEESWQEFVMERQEALEDKLNTNSLSSEYLKRSSELNGILETIENKELTNNIWDAIAGVQSVTTYMHYNKGFLDGIKFAIMAGQL